jgi:hypothetical protein
LSSCWKNNEEGESLYAEDNTPIDSTLVDSVVGQASFSAINSAIIQSQQKEIPKNDTVKTHPKEDSKEKELVKTQPKKDQLSEETSSKEKLQKEKKIEELIETPEN